MKTSIYLILLITTLNINAQTHNNRSAQLKEIADKIEAYYIFENIGKELSQKLNIEIKNKTFDKFTNQEFADSLSSYLAKNGNDLHFNVLYRPIEKKEEINEKELLKQYDAINKQWNYGFEKILRLDGNIGYIQYTGFPPANKSAIQTLNATMDFVSNTNALILDLRDNNGGDGEMVKQFLSYFFTKKTKISESYTRFNNKTNISYTNKKVGGKKYLNKPIYILVNNRTISAAEALAYELQKNKGAIIIGEKTYGAANPVKAFYIDNLFHLFVPISEVKNAITQSNWEHKGVDLDVKIKSEKALNMAHGLALEKLLNNKAKMELTEKEVQEKIRGLKIELEK
ncbi:interphotoreceptor retinoid-binding protein [Neptunitalea chrysea]|uniref:Interphotoreceptor retinoid-binding protein n=1 Tax=Neptunitalea chrysea TaxID=1647581 RepID=A0A9W6EUV7_9FLAO|nr:S41 family peptidase [Neptunitalea chrysea]GLB53975.1 interphotoreceptor retinoid-binding protein [Neptunitalea chrysea]